MPTIEHTPGPWTVGEGHVWHNDEATGMGYRFKPIDFPGGALAWVADDEGDPEGEANARLIAAAPKLAEALRELIEMLEDDGATEGPHGGIREEVYEARAALAEAGLTPAG